MTIAAIDWCPQLCPKKNKTIYINNSDKKPGFIIDIVKAVFKNSPFELEIEYYPWSRAIKLVKEGKIDVLLSPAKAEAPSLRYPKEEIGIQRMCFFTSKKSSWNYIDAHSLNKMQIGIGNDTSIEELNDYVKENPEQFQFQPYLGRYLKQSIRKLDNKRIDTFIFTYNTTMYELTRMGVVDKYRNAGCVNTTNIYMAFTAKNDNKTINKAITLFDKKMAELHKKGKIKKIMGNYKLSSWRK
ncbi:substrate-binding periplasmic protein [Pseudoalteromonas denitrificans]|uniref:substrate-binding periplasmic protein n=1 Tax=Pseudoalteromonas denitrificans TaxID=43656 RepID=UPI0015A6FDA2|nr:transporter substrate-binding domain-containing protein [Pseudoalteromonas denitrificans]